MCWINEDFCILNFGYVVKYGWVVNFGCVVLKKCGFVVFVIVGVFVCCMFVFGSIVFLNFGIGEFFNFFSGFGVGFIGGNMF